MFLPHGKHGAALAGDGTVVVAGGEAESHLVAVLDPPCGMQVPPDANSVVEIFDPSTLSWRFGPGMSQRRALFHLVRLADGRLLAAGGADSRDAEIYDPAAGGWSYAGTMHSSRVGAAYARLLDGRVVVAGGSFGGCDPTAEVYDPDTNTWTLTGDMSIDRRDATATRVRLPNGTERVLVAGGVDNQNDAALSTAELYDPATNSWTATGSMTAARAGATPPRCSPIRARCWSPGEVPPASRARNCTTRPPAPGRRSSRWRPLGRDIPPPSSSSAASRRWRSSAASPGPSASRAASSSSRRLCRRAHSWTHPGLANRSR
jgi:hypothetical protein